MIPWDELSGWTEFTVQEDAAPAGPGHVSIEDESGLIVYPGSTGGEVDCNDPGTWEGMATDKKVQLRFVSHWNNIT